MALIVQKYGGTSVGTVERIQGVAQKVKGFREQGHDVVVVVSAMSGETNRLIGMANEISQRPVPREMDVLVSTGEQVTIALLAMALPNLAVRQEVIPVAKSVSTPTALTPRRVFKPLTMKICTPTSAPVGL